MLEILGIILPIMVAVYIFWLQRRRKSLTYEIINCTYFVNANADDRLKVYFDNRSVQDICSVAVNISNTGNRAIGREDFDCPVTLHFGEKTRILAVDNETKPEALEAQVRINNNIIELSPILINCGDSITFRIIADQFCKDDFQVRGRIRDMKNIIERSAKRPFRFFVAAGMLLIVIGPILGSNLFLSSCSASDIKSILWLLYSINLMSLFLIGGGLMRRLPKLKKTFHRLF